MLKKQFWKSLCDVKKGPDDWQLAALALPAELFILCISAGKRGGTRGLFFSCRSEFLCLPHVQSVLPNLTEILWPVLLKMSGRWPLVFAGEAAIPPDLFRGLSPAVHLHLHAQGHDLGALEQTHHVFFRRADTPSPPSICMQSPTAAWQPAAELLRYAVCLGGSGGGDGVGWGGGLSWKWVKAFRRRPQSGARELLGCVSAQTLTCCLHRPCKHPPCWGQRRTWGGVCTSRNTPNAWASITVQGGGFEQQRTIKEMGE